MEGRSLRERVRRWWGRGSSAGVRPTPLLDAATGSDEIHRRDVGLEHAQSPDAADRKGETSYRLRRWWGRGSLVAGATALLALLVCAALLLWPTDVPSFAAVKARWTPSDAFLLDRNGEVIDQLRMDMQVRRLEWVPLGSISPALTAAIVDGEDHRFWAHGGVDYTALLSAMRDSAVAQRRRGASTITMQVAALIDPQVRAGSGDGSWWRKLAQIRAARALDAEWSKREILEAYLNLLGFRGELQGIGAASRVLAGKAPSGLSLEESLVLAALLPSPGANADRIVARACARATERRLNVACSSIREAAQSLLAGTTLESAPGQRRAGHEHTNDNHLAPHLARALLHKPGERVNTRLDAGVQRLASNVLATHLAGLVGRNVRDGAVLVLDNATGDVVAYVGSAGPQSRAHQVDGVRAHRQAGSTLKPFLYELALQRHYLTAASLLNDAPVTLETTSGVYLPQNYDRDFKGLVSVRTALGNSLNVPAVRALMLVGVEPLRDRLHSLGYAGITQPGDFYGFSLALGSAEVSLWEQVHAYRALALRATALASTASEEARLSQASAFIIADILSDRSARSITFGLDNHLETPFWSAVKTGTSKDMRDNWCIGFSRAYTVGVWVGNFEGDSMHDVSGVTGAAPVWQQIMLALHAQTPSAAPRVPAGVTTTLARFSPAIEPMRTEYFLRDDSAPVATIRAAKPVARIESPANGMVIAIDPDIPTQLQRVPLAARGAENGMILKLNGKTVGQAASNVMWPPSRGVFVLALEDATGHTLDSARFIVR